MGGEFLANPLLLDIELYLIEQEVLVEDSASRNFEPPDPDDWVILHEYQGSSLKYYEQEVTNRSVQILVRSKDTEAARLKALEIFRSLKSDTARVDFTPDRWGQVYLRNTPFMIKKDAVGRVYYGFNMGITTTID